jgi:large subunit ribosomal protein L10
MPLSIEGKRELVEEVSQVAATAHSAVAAEYRGLTVSELTSLRVEARKADVYLKVVKNTLARRAVAGTEFECMQSSLKGPLVLAFSRADPGAAARVIKGFAKEHEKLIPVAIALGGELYAPAELDRVAALPTLSEARAQLLRVLNGPMSQLVRTLAEPAAMLARTLSQRGQQAG